MILNSTNGKNIKILFNPSSESLLIGDLVKIINKDGTGIIGQAINIESVDSKDHNNIAKIKILFSLTSQKAWIEWIGNIPSKESRIEKVLVDELLFHINSSNNQPLIPLGSLPLYNDAPNYVNSSKLKQPTVIFCDKQTQRIDLSLCLSQAVINLLSKVIILDFRGEYPNIPGAVRLEIGKDLKLPLNSHGIDLIYQKTLSDISIESKAIIENIFMEVQDYADSCELGYIPFSSFREVVEDQHKNSDITELIILKNSLAKLDKQGIYANDTFEIEALKLYIEKCNLVIVDFSKVNTIWHKTFVESIINSNTINQQNFFLLFEAGNNNIDSELIDKLFVQGYQSGINSIVSIGYNSQFANNIMAVSKNMIFCPPGNNVEFLSGLNILINKLNHSEILIYGDISGRIPIFANINKNIVANSPVQNIQPVQQSQNQPKNLNNLVESYVHHVNTENAVIENRNTAVQPNKNDNAVKADDEIENFEFYQEDFEADIQQAPSNTQEIINQQQNDPEEEIPYEPEEQFSSSQQVNYDNSIQEINNSNSDIPIYSANDEANSDFVENDFQEGDVVVHQRYGRGVIKKIIGYGNKFLFSINFDNFGKKLLDPELAIIEKG